MKNKNYINRGRLCIYQIKNDVCAHVGQNDPANNYYWKIMYKTSKAGVMQQNDNSLL